MAKKKTAKKRTKTPLVPPIHIPASVPKKKKAMCGIWHCITVFLLNDPKMTPAAMYARILEYKPQLLTSTYKTKADYIREIKEAKANLKRCAKELGF